MNISASALLEARERDGAAAEDRSDVVDDALEADREVGWREGKPLVSHPDGADDGLEIGEDPTEAYNHYVRGDGLLRPDAGDFLRRLCEAVDTVAEAAEETQTDESTIRKACRLHGIEPPVDDVEDDAPTVEEISLPSGESIPQALLEEPPHRDKLVLATLLSLGMSVGEIARYLSRETDERVTEAEVRAAAEEHRLLAGGGSDTRDLIPEAERTVTAGDDEPASSPW